MSDSSSFVDGAALLKALSKVSGGVEIITNPSAQRSFLQGMMFSDASSQALAVVLPKTLLGVWQVLKICGEADIILIAQAANTGLTGGSTPYGKYDRPVIVLSMQYLQGIFLLNQGSEVVALPAATLQQLEKQLTLLEREPHSVLGSTCVGASVIGGICNNSGGALLQRGPAYTEKALFARRLSNGQFELVNHLDIDLGNDPETILTRLQHGEFSEVDVQYNKGNKTKQDYAQRVRDIYSDTPARYNNDPNGLYEASGSAGRVIIFAVRVASYPKPKREQVYYFSCNQADTLTALRREILGGNLPLPVSAEYMDYDYNQITLKYGRDTCWFLRNISASRIGAMYRLRHKVNGLLAKIHLPTTWPDRLLQGLSHFMPRPLSKKLTQQAKSYRYHLTLKVADQEGETSTIAAFEQFLPDFLARHEGSYHTCNQKEGEDLLLFRFAATAAMLRYHALHSPTMYGELISTDIALPRNAKDWDEVLPSNLQNQVKKTLYLGHFFCHVFHQDYFLKPEADPEKFKQELLTFYDSRHIEYPAEHNVGHLYQAKPALRDFYRQLDPTNSLNPGIGKTTKNKNWQ